MMNSHNDVTFIFMSDVDTWKLQITGARKILKEAAINYWRRRPR